MLNPSEVSNQSISSDESVTDSQAFTRMAMFEGEQDEVLRQGRRP
jgi:hypothetical protein